MELKLTKPVIFFDLETTGTNITHDRIVEISLIKIMPNGEEFERTRRINPEMPIPAEATAVHHITDADVADAPKFGQIAKDLAKIFEGCDIAGFNSNKFDVPMLAEEFLRAGVKFDFTKPRYIDVQNIFHRKEQRTLVAAYRFYCGKELDDAHSANADTRATYEVLKAQLDRYDDLQNDVDYLAEFSTHAHNVDLMGRLIYDDKKREIINFGKYKGQVAADVLRRDPGYYNWIMQGDFAQNTKDVFTNIKLRLKNNA
ncbi:MAG: 3'-5' exonuclease [Bacteroides sp.]|nr:3'-5' exonuclease [Bacteroides sp.]MBD5331219.1 3'-5' exonuclease [Bacteroides sp.]MBD5374971.1 3'-5' exonuclease [Bacteroides sp.]MDE7461429.1 3'-5' exonuclease [Paramuribaculum sp.]